MNHRTMKTPVLFARRLPLLAAASLALGAPLAVFGQTAPDAGRLLQEAAPPLQPPRPAAVPHIDAPALTAAAPGGPQITVETVQITGNTVFTTERLKAALGAVEGRRFDLAGLRELANRLSAFYREAGYPFARAYVPTQDMASGALRIDVVEGRYGQVRARGDAAFTGGAASFLAPLHTGDVIASDPLERATLLLSDLPGIQVTPVVKPGAATGSGDLDVQVGRANRFDGEVGIDDDGDRYTGQYRAHASLDANSALAFGDQISARLMLTSENMWFGNLGYAAPLGGSGLRGQASVAHTYYKLGGEFADLDGTGTADVTSAGLSYPLLRSQARNLGISLGLTHKELLDRQGVAGTHSAKTSDSVPLTLNFDARDQWAGGGISYGTLTLAGGHLKLDATSLAADAGTARTRGDFTRFDLDVARIQTLTASTSLYAHLSGQWADKNLDSSESFGLGGASGVRAYPEGEACGDEGLLGQVELRYSAGAFSPYAFFDAGKVRFNVDSWTTGSNTRSLAGAGLGVRYAQGAWSAEGAIASRTSGGRPQSDSRDFNPAFWASVAYRF
jgi:hemolysin activation/secretion protein